MDVGELITEHNGIKESMCKQIDLLKATEIRLLNALETLKEKQNAVSQELAKARVMSKEASDKNSESDKRTRSTTRSLEQAKAKEAEVEQRLQQVNDDKLRITSEWESLDKQRKDLNDFKSELIVRQRNVEIDERRIMNMRVQVDKLIEDHKLRKELGLG